MTGARITVDGLWRCLYPSIDAATLARAASVSCRPRPARSRAPNQTRARAGPRRHLHATSRQRLQDADDKPGEPVPPAAAPQAEARTGEQQHSAVAPQASDFDEGPSMLKVDQGVTEAWRGYFDVVFTLQNRPSVPVNKAGLDPLHDVFGPEAKEKTGPDPDPDPDPDPSFQSSQSPEVRETEEVSPPAVESEVVRTDPFQEIVAATAAAEAVDYGLDAEREHKDHVPQTVGLEESASPALDSSGGPDIEQATTSVGQASSQEKVAEYRAPQGDGNTIVQRLIDMKPPFTHVPPEATTEDILLAIRGTRMRGPKKFRRITATLLKHLLSMPGAVPSATVYDTLFRAHSLPEGSADVVNELLKEMRRYRIRWSPMAYHSVLRLLAVHPDYLLRNDIIREMHERWIEIRPKGHRYIAIGLLRDGQYELALEKLEEMVGHGVHVEPWVFDIFICVFGKLELLDDALRIARYRVDRGFEVPVNIWYYLLDVCSKAQNHMATSYVWNRTVRQGIVNPSDGIALNILNMAAVYGDTDLATEVIQYLAERGTRLARPHYEALADAYSIQGNVERALEVYCIMYGAGAEVALASVGTLCQVLARDPTLIDKAVEAMTGLRRRYKLPISVYNAVLNETVKSSALPADEAFARGLGLYQRVREFVPAGPNWDTFRYLLTRCTKPDVAQFLEGEMIAFDVRPNLAIAELLFRVHVEHNGPAHRVKNQFYRIAPHLRSSYPLGSRRRKNVMGLAVRLVKRLIADGDPEAWRILDVCRRNGLEEHEVTVLREEVEAGRLSLEEDSSSDPDAPEEKDPFAALEQKRA